MEEGMEFYGGSVDEEVLINGSFDRGKVDENKVVEEE